MNQNSPLEAKRKESWFTRMFRRILGETSELKHEPIDSNISVQRVVVDLLMHDHCNTSGRSMMKVRVDRGNSVEDYTFHCRCYAPWLQNTWEREVGEELVPADPTGPLSSRTLDVLYKAGGGG